MSMPSIGWRGFLCGVLFLLTSALAPANTNRPIRIPLTFEQNKGQVAKPALYVAHSASGDILLTEKGLSFASANHGNSPTIALPFIGATNSTPSAELPTGGFANYYTSSDSKNWLSRLPLFARVRYHGIYRRIDAIFHSRLDKAGAPAPDQLEYDFEVEPGGDPSKIKFRIDQADRVSLSTDGHLEISAGSDTWRILAPSAYQLRNRKQIPVPVAFALSQDRVVSFRVGSYDPGSTLVIDPVVESSFFLPTSTLGTVVAIQLDANQNIILAGSGSYKASVVKLNPAGTAILYSTQIGSANAQPAAESTPTALGLDSQGDAYLAGITNASDFPLTSSILGSCMNGFCNAGFVTKFGTDGTLSYSTLLGSGQELPRSITVDSNGSAYVAGLADDSEFLTVNAFQPSAPTCPGCESGFFAKLNPSGTNYVFASYLNGPGKNFYEMTPITAIALDSLGNVFIAGETNADIPLLDPWESGSGGLFIAKFASDGKTLLFSTRFGSSAGNNLTGPMGDTLAGMAIGSNGTVYLAGTTGSDFPFSLNMPLALNSTLSPVMFAAAVDPTLTKLTYALNLGSGNVYSTYLDASGNFFVGGTSPGLSLLPLQNAVVSDVTTSGFFVELNSSGSPSMVSQLGGHFYGVDPTALAVNASSEILAAGSQTSGASSSSASFFGSPISSDPILIGPGIGSASGSQLTIISPSNTPELSLSTVGPFLSLRNPSSAALHISSINLGGALSKQWGNCPSTVFAGSSCILTVTNSGGLADVGTVSITSDAQPTVQTFNITVNGIPRTPVGDQLWAGDVLVSYPPQFQGTTSNPLPVTIWNVGTANATLNSITATGSLSETDNCNAQNPSGAVLLPGGSCVLQISMTPDGSQAQLNFVYDTTRTANPYFYIGSGTSYQLLLSASTINFGTQRVGGVALPRVVSVTNTGDTPFPTPSVSLAGDPQFVMPANTCTATLAPHQSCEISVQFVPTTGSMPTATLNVSGQQVTLTANGEFGSVVQVNPLEIDYPSQGPVFGLPYTLPLTVTNTSSSAVPIVGVSFSLPDYSESDNCQGQVPANGSCTMQVSFTAQQMGLRTASMTIMFGGGITGQVITLKGTGGFPITIQPSSLDFGSSTAVGTTSAIEYVELGNGVPSIQHYTTSTTGDFAVVAGPYSCPNPIPSFTGCGLGVAFEPRTAGSQQGTLTISYPGIPFSSVITLTGSTGTPGLNVIPGTLTFATTTLGSTAQLPPALQIFNNGGSTVSISGYVLGGANPGDFQISNECANIAGGGECFPSLNFIPTGSGSRTASLTITSNAQNGPQTVTLSGIGIAPQMSAPSNLTFNNELVGSSQEQTVTVSNPGNASLTLSTIALSGPLAGDFHLAPGQCSTVGGGAGCEIHIFFTPTAVGLRTATLTLGGNAAQSPLVVALSGNGVSPAINVPASLAFATEAVGSSESLGLLVSNTGTANLSISSFTITGPNAGDFQATLGSCSTIVMGASCSTQISFVPSAVGARSATLTLYGNAQNSPQSIALTGTGLAPSINTPSTLAFANLAVGATSQQTLTVSNNGAAPLSITNVALTGTNAGDYQVTLGQCSVIAPAMSCGMQVAFTPGAAGQRTATITITSNASNGPQTVALSGTGVAPFVAQPASGSSSSVSVTSGNTATYTLAASASPGFTGIVQYTCTGAPQNATCSVQPTSVNFSTTLSTNLAVSVTTTGSTTAAIRFDASLFFGLVFVFPLALVVLPRAKKLPLRYCAFFVFLVVSGCGGGAVTNNSGSGTGTTNPTGTRTPAGTYTLTVTGMSGAQTQSVNLTLVVQ